MKKIAVFLFLLFLSCPALLVEAKIITAPTPDYPTAQKALDSASYGDEVVILKGEYLFNAPLSIKEKGLTLSAKGKVIFTNKKGAAIIADGCNIINGITFFRNEIAIEGNNSVVSIINCQFKKNRIGIKTFNSALTSNNNYFEINYLAAITLLGGNNIIKITPSNSFKDNYTDVFSTSNLEILNSDPEGNKISLGNLKD